MVFENQGKAFDCVEGVVVLDVLVQAVHAILVIRQTRQNGGPAKLVNREADSPIQNCH